MSTKLRKNCLLFSITSLPIEIIRSSRFFSFADKKIEGSLELKQLPV